MIFSVLIIVVALMLASFLTFSRRLRGSSDWNATVTPLASIMGSGFLVSAPLLAGVVGYWAVVFMSGLLVLAFLVGSVIRFNIRHFEPIEHQGHGPAQSLAFTSRLMLALAYFISVSYYLQLLAAFVLNAFQIQNPGLANLITTSILLVIGGVGIIWGLGELEKVEKFAVGLNLGVVGALIFALLVHNGQLFDSGQWALPSVSPDLSVHSLRVVLGLLIVVQGFETSRYLGDAHPAEQRIKTMRRAQLISAGIYLVFIALATVLFREGLGSDVTAIIAMTAPVAAVLPMMLSVAAIGSQFSAAVADNAGAGGLLKDLSNNRLSMRQAYLMVMMVTIGLTWGSNVNQIIAYASRAFAIYYALQCAVALALTWRDHTIAHRLVRLPFFLMITLVCLGVAVFGLPSE